MKRLAWIAILCLLAYVCYWIAVLIPQLLNMM